MFIGFDITGQGQLRRQQAAFVVPPDFLAELGLLQCWGKGAEIGAQVDYVTLEHFGGVAVAGCVDRLWQIDDHRAVGIDQDVVLGEVAVNDTGTEHAHHLIDQCGVIFERQCLAEFDIVQARCRIAFGIDHQIHQQHALKTEVRLRYAHAGSR